MIAFGSILNYSNYSKCGSFLNDKNTIIVLSRKCNTYNSGIYFNTLLCRYIDSQTLSNIFVISYSSLLSKIMNFGKSLIFFITAVNSNNSSSCTYDSFSEIDISTKMTCFGVLYKPQSLSVYFWYTLFNSHIVQY